MRVAIIGCGVMGTAFAQQLAKKGCHLVLCDRNPHKAASLAEKLSAKHAEDPAKAVKSADFILLAIKPKDLDKLAHQMEKEEGKVILSMLMGVTIASLKGYFPKCEVIRLMPNLALKYGQSVIALVQEPSVTEGVVQSVSDLFDGLGLIVWTGEEKIDPITAIAGSGPAFVIAMIEAMVESGIAMGLRAAEAQTLSLQTVRGALALIEGNEGHPGSVRWEICAPGGSTIAGMRALEDSGVRAGIMNTFMAAFERARRET